MKAKKVKSSKKIAKKGSSRAAKKELEATITDKFMGVIAGLGHDAGKIGKEIKKASKQLAKKLADKFQDMKESVEEKFENTTKAKAIKKPLTSAKMSVAKAASKAEKVVAKATKANTDTKPAKRAYTRRAAPVTAEINGASKTAGTKKTKVVSKTNAKPTSGRRRVASKPASGIKPEETVVKGSTAEAAAPTEQNPQEETNNTI